MIALLSLKLLIFMVLVSHEPYQAFQQEPDCSDCHSDITGRAVVHEAIEAGCDNCHQPTGEEHPKNGVAGFSLIDQTPQLCFYCHSEPSGMRFSHKPFREGECLSCHDVHSADESRLLNSGIPDLCMKCHNRAYETDSTHTDNIEMLLAKGRYIHSALSDGECMICHLPHESDYRSVLVDAYPGEPYVAALPDSFAICFMCHDAGIIEAEKTDWATNFRNGDQNLHYLHINGNKGRNCYLCHNVHAAPGQFLIQDEVPFGNWKMKMNFRVEENGGSCLPGCHGPETYDRNY